MQIISILLALGIFCSSIKWCNQLFFLFILKFTYFNEIKELGTNLKLTMDTVFIGQG